MTKITEKKFFKNIIDYYLSLPNSKLNELILQLPNLKEIQNILVHRLITKLDLLPIKIILDIYEHFYINNDGPCYKNLINEYIPTALLFYAGLSEEDIKEFLYDKINSMSILKELINKLNGKVTSKKNNYIKILKKMKKEYSKLYLGLEEDKFVM